MSYHKHFHSQEHAGICVVRRKGESGDELLKRFRKKFSKSGISKELRDRMYFEKPSDKRRRKKLQSIRSIKREEEKMQLLQEKMTRKRLKGRKNKKKGRKYDSSNRRQDSNNFNEKD
jgi:small subunit ribosomal protein S21